MRLNSIIQALNTREKLLRILLLLIATVTIVYFMPREGKFRYEFQEGKPWRYGLLTAPFDFTIYKTDAQIKNEKDSIMQRFHPYYRIDIAPQERQLDLLQKDYETGKLPALTPPSYRYLRDALSKLYAGGIISNTENSLFQNNQTQTIRILEQNMWKLHTTHSLLTVRKAYQQLMADAPNASIQRALQQSNVSKFIEPNLHADKMMSDKVRSELLQTISTSVGIVQTGERIVDRGVIITPETYNMLRSLEMESQERAGTTREQSLTVGGQFCIVLLLLTSLLGFIQFFRTELFKRKRNIICILLLATCMSVACALLGHFRVLSIYMVPLAMVPIVIRTFFDSRIGFFTHIITVLICSFMAPFAFEFILLQVAAGIICIFSLKELTQRSQLAKVAIMVFLSYALIYVCYSLVMEGNWEKVNPTMFLYFFINAIALLFTYLFIFILEKLFGFTSNVTLVELSNINSPLLRRLSEECPGTFQHSIQVSNLCALAARKINANVQLVRTAALYHDIGKLSNPSFFTENQQGINPHDQLDTEQSVSIIKQHVADGIRLAQREKLPEDIIAFIATHHGDGKIRYFYNRWKNEHPDEDIDESMFHYPGPKPYTKEQALLMITDSVEAASRSLKEYNEQACSKLINSIIDQLIQEDMLSDTPLSFRDLQTIKQVYIERLLSMYHNRVSYPELKGVQK